MRTPEPPDPAAVRRLIAVEVAAVPALLDQLTARVPDAHYVYGTGTPPPVLGVIYVPVRQEPHEPD